MNNVYKFDEILNDLMDYFIIGDPDCLLRYQQDHQLTKDYSFKIKTSK